MGGWLGLDPNAYIFRTPAESRVNSSSESAAPLDLALVFGGLTVGIVLLSGCAFMAIRVHKRANAVRQIQAEEAERGGGVPQPQTPSSVAWGWSPKSISRKPA